MIIGTPRKLQGDGKAQIGNERKRMRRVDGKRRQDREDRFQKMVFQPFLFVFRQGGRANDLDIFLFQLLAQRAQTLLLLRLKAPHLFQNEIKLLLRCAPVGAAQGYACANLTGQTGNAHHEELIEIGRRDGKEA
ncbi:Uncharacterised protein [Brucella melitensis]|nr:Uncharacterised protein [Brucella melitensis]